MLLLKLVSELRQVCLSCHLFLLKESVSNLDSHKCSISLSDKKKTNYQHFVLHNFFKNLGCVW